ncbi:hypothetical protein FQ154_19465 [Paeniglutamicibacter gangotriensis]|uniref:DUF6398 domain-containing protein n=1 Tax=Paeniglutamicibacter gangotriensis TaxID=254787 RepID=A0A5B0E5Y0_9MICC|nr:hypothetical protein FQ154_19465 [Paeniglutamicibacter gangotriensis]
MVGKLARKRPTSLLRGDLRIWASGVIYALASQNLLFDKTQPMHLGAEHLGELLGVKKTPMGDKGNIVRNLLKIGVMDPEFTHSDLVRDNPLTWMLLIDGLQWMCAGSRSGSSARRSIWDSARYPRHVAFRGELERVWPSAMPTG